MYLVTAQCVQKLLNNDRCYRMHEPVDVMLWSLHSQGKLRNVTAWPPICLTVGEHSDTSHIR